MLGRYELVRVLGRGGMAEVYLARRRGPGGVEKRLAIKRIRRERATDPRWLEMFVAEARLSMAMVHRNVVPTFDFGRVGDELFLVMEYVDGADLAAALAKGRERDRPIPAPVAAYLAMEACQALDYAHTPRGADAAEQGVVHRDVTPRNVLLSYNGEVKLMDFGVATTETDLGEAGKVRGTPAYMAPEQARGLPVDPRADLFAIGLVLWEALAGRRAYAGDNVAELLSVARAGAVPALPGDVPRRLREIVAIATATDPDDRYPSARAMQLELDDYLVGVRSGDARTTPLDHQLSGWLREVCPPARVGRDGATVAVPDGRVITFLDQGEGEIGGTPSSLGRTTLASLAETVDAPDPPDAPDASDAPELAAAVAPRGRRRRVAVAAVVAGALVALVAAIVAGRGSPDATTRDGPTTGRADGPAAARVGRATLVAPVPEVESAPAENPDPPVESAPAIESFRVATPAAEADRTATAPVHHGPGSTPARTPARTPAPAQPGQVRISAAPWAAVAIEGREGGCAETPCSLDLPAGAYVLLLRNPVAELDKRIEIEVVAGETTDVVATLTPRR